MPIVIIGAPAPIFIDSSQGTPGNPSPTAGVMTIQGISGGAPIYGVVGVTGPVGITGTIAVDNFPDNQGVTGVVGVVGPVGITGPISVNNFPNNQGVTGRVGVSGTVSIIGPVGVTGPISVSNFPSSQGITGSVRVIGPVGSTGPLVVTQGTPASLPGAWPFRITDGVNSAAVKAPSTAASTTDAALVVALSPNNVIPMSMATGTYGGQVEGVVSDGATGVSKPVLVGGQDGGVSRFISVDSFGRVIIAPAGASAEAAPGLAPGLVSTAATTRVAVRSTTYTEQTSNAQRSIVSSNANDSSAGTGARTVRITYYTATFTGPFVETVTLNGTTPVNTVSTNICYIEKMEVRTVGNTGSNVGLISLKGTTGGGGATIASILATNNETFFAHHYVADGVSCYVTGISVCHNGTTVGSGGLFVIRSKPLDSADAVNDQIGDFVRLYGQSSTVTRTWGTALKVDGPALITVLVTPETGSSTIYRASIDFYDE